MFNFSDATVSAIVSALTAVVGAVVALVSVNLTNRTNEKTKAAELAHAKEIRQEDLFRGRGEELYQLLGQWATLHFCGYLVKADIMLGRFTYDQGLDLVLDAGKESKVDFARLEMLIDVYFNDLRPKFDLVLKYRNEANKIVSEHKRGYAKGEIDGTGYVQPFLAKQKQLEQEIVGLKALIVQKIRDT